MIAYCEAKENCRRQVLLGALGDTERLQQDRTKCCCHCTPRSLPYPKLAQVLKKVTRKRKRNEAEQSLSIEEAGDLAKRLKEVGDSIVDKSIGLRMLGSEIVCDEITINKICKNALHIQSIQDMSKISNLRPQFYEPMFRVVNEVTAKLPSVQ